MYHLHIPALAHVVIFHDDITLFIGLIFCRLLEGISFWVIFGFLARYPR